MSFEEFMELFRAAKCCLKIEDSPEFKMVYEEIVKTGLRFPSGERTVDEVIRRKNTATHLVAAEREHILRLLFSHEDYGGHKSINAKEILLDNSVVEDLVSLLNT